MGEGAPAAWRTIETGFENTLHFQNHDTGSGGNTVNMTQARVRRLFGNLVSPDYDQRLEKSHWLTRQFGQNLTADRPPLIHFGVLPVQSNAAMAPTATFANVCGIWQIETELECEYSYDFTNAGTQDLNIKSFDPVQLAIYNKQHLVSGSTIYVNNKYPVIQGDTITPS